MCLATGAQASVPGVVGTAGAEGAVLACLPTLAYMLGFQKRFQGLETTGLNLNVVAKDSRKPERVNYRCLEALSGQSNTILWNQQVNYNVMGCAEGVVVGGCGSLLSEAPGRPSCPWTVTTGNCLVPDWKARIY